MQPLNKVGLFLFIVFLGTFSLSLIICFGVEDKKYSNKKSFLDGEFGMCDWITRIEEMRIQNWSMEKKIK